MLPVLHFLIPPSLTIVQIRPEARKVVLIARSNVESSACPACGHSSKRLHSRYFRQLADLPWHGRVVQVHPGARRLCCSNSECSQQIFTERLPDFVRPRARRTTRCGQSQLAIGFATGGEPGSRLSHKLAMPVSGDTLLRMIKVAEFEPAQSPRVIGIDDWAWRKGQRYGTIICDLERGRVLDLLPDRNAASVATWLKRHPGIEIIARDRAGLYAEGARRGAPEATQIADRWHLLNNIGDALRLVLGRHRKAVRTAASAWIAEIDGEKNTEKQLVERVSNVNLRQQRRDERHERYAEISRLRQAGQSPRQIAPKLGMSVRTVERWLAAGGEPEHRRPPAEHTCIEPFRNHLERRWQEGQHEGVVLLAEIQQRGYRGGKATFYRWLASYRGRPVRTPRAILSKSDHRVPSRRTCAWLLGQAPDKLDEANLRFLHHLFENTPKLQIASELARRLAAILRGDDEAALDRWIIDSMGTELDSLAKGIRRDVGAVKAAIRHSWSTSPVEGRINRLKTIKRQMYGRAGCELLRSRLLASA